MASLYFLDGGRFSISRNLMVLHTQYSSIRGETSVARLRRCNSRCKFTASLIQKNRERSNGHVLYEKMLQLSSRSWNSKMIDCCMNGHYEDALSHLHTMRRRDVRATDSSFSALLKVCAVRLSIEVGKALHAAVIKEGYSPNIAIIKALINLYAKCGNWSSSRRLFHEVHTHDNVAWNILLSAYAGSQLYGEVLQLLYLMHTCDKTTGPKPSAITMAIVLPVCARLGALELGQSLHAYVIKTALQTHTLVGNALVSLYAKCGQMFEAYKVFSNISQKDVVSWNSMIAGYVENRFPVEAFETFSQMFGEDVEPNYATIANVLPVCAALEDWCHGKEIHGYVLRKSVLVTDVSVCNALMTFYSNMGHMNKVEFIFQEMALRDLVSWNTIITGFAQNSLLHDAFFFFHELLRIGMKPDSVTLLSILPVCSQLRDQAGGQRIHAFVLKNVWLSKSTAVGNALISFYSKCGNHEEAFRTFAMMKKDLISWNTMLAAYADIGAGRKLLELFGRMWMERHRPDHVTILSLLRGFATFGVRGIKQAHSYCIRSGLVNETAIGNTLIDMYAKHGILEHAFKTFKSMVEKNVVTGNAMISGYVKQGCQEGAQMIFNRMCEKNLTTLNLMLQLYAQNESLDEAVGLFLDLQDQGMRPDIISILSILPVCANLGSVHLLRQLHGYATRACLSDICLDAALLDMYSKCGSIKDANKIFQARPRKDIVMVTAMISGYAMHGMGEEALKVFSEMLELEMKPDHILVTAVLSACSHAGLVQEGWNCFSSMEQAYGIKPTMEHYACMVDLLARSGNLKEAYNFIRTMPLQPNTNVWGSLLGSCKTHHAVELGRVAAKHLSEVEEDDIGHYVVLSNIYAADGKWDKVEELRGLMKKKYLKKPPGCSSIDVNNGIHVFVADDFHHPQRIIIYSLLSSLDQQIKDPISDGE
ncbi:putative pentatricopeptide repeat-containing protein At5g08490 [Aristolochia californica]|uniref:putative pentatricopeptide repeat-containing protein At5g08490 n=1 Tax=Aristolochia californica TaxID=171875 RepID=UPI0035D5A836